MPPPMMTIAEPSAAIAIYEKSSATDDRLSGDRKIVPVLIVIGLLVLYIRALPIPEKKAEE